LLKLIFDIEVDITGIIAFTDLWEEWESVFALASLTRPQNPESNQVTIIC